MRLGRTAFPAQRLSRYSAAGMTSGSICVVPPMSGIPSPMSKDARSVPGHRSGSREAAADA